MRGFRRVIGEVHRRSLWQVLAIYLVGAWVAYQVILGLYDGIGLPDWVPGFAVVLFLIGLPIVLATAFVQEGPPPRPALLGGDDPWIDPTLHPELSGLDASAAGSSGDVAPHWLTWRRSLLAGLAAFVLLAIGTAAFMAMRTLGIGPAGTLVAQGVLAERERVILADFDDLTGDSLLAAVVTEALRVDLSESRALRLLERSELRDVLVRMERADVARMDVDLAREVAQREGIKAVVAGEVGAAGSGYVLTARVLSADGAALVSVRETAAGEDELLEAVDALSGKLRERIGESLKEIRAGEPLEQVTTASLDALRRYTLGIRALDRGEDDTGVRLLEEAIAIDTAFAMAYRKLGIALVNRQEEEARQLAVFRAAVRHADRLNERERYHARASLAQTLNQWQESAELYEALLALYPGDHVAANNLGLAYTWLQNAEKSEQMYLLAVQSAGSSSSAATALGNLVYARLQKKDVSGALQAAQEYRTRFPEPAAAADRHEAAARLAGGDLIGGELLLRTRYERAAEGSNLALRARAAHDLARTAYRRGKMSDGDELLEATAAIHERRELGGEVLELGAERAFVDAWIRGDPDAARRRLDALLERVPLASVSSADRPYLLLAATYAIIGDAGRARALLTEYERIADSDLRRGARAVDYVSRGLLAFAEGRFEDAIAEVKRAGGLSPCSPCSLIWAGYAYEALDRPEEAIGAYEAVLRSTDLPRTGLTGPPFVMTGAYHDATIHEQLAALYDRLGNPTKAAQHYQKVVEIWAEADPELRPRVEAARRRLVTLARMRG